jgi:hypothetical protein
MAEAQKASRTFSFAVGFDQPFGLAIRGRVYTPLYSGAELYPKTRSPVRGDPWGGEIHVYNVPSYATVCQPK